VDNTVSRLSCSIGQIIAFDRGVPLFSALIRPSDKSLRVTDELCLLELGSRPHMYMYTSGSVEPFFTQADISATPSIIFTGSGGQRVRNLASIFDTPSLLSRPRFEMQ